MQSAQSYLSAFSFVRLSLHFRFLFLGQIIGENEIQDILLQLGDSVLIGRCHRIITVSRNIFFQAADFFGSLFNLVGEAVTLV